MLDEKKCTINFQIHMHTQICENHCFPSKYLCIEQSNLVLRKYSTPTDKKKIIDIAYDHDHSLMTVLLFISNNVNILFDIKLPICHY